MRADWSAVQLRDVAKPVVRPIRVVPGEKFRTIGVKWWGEGAYERQTIDGSETAARTLSLVRAGDLIINKIWVRHGSIAVASPCVDGCAASGEFPTFELDRSAVLPEWIGWHAKTRGFWARCNELSRGSSGKNRIKPDLFLTVRIPLPPLAEQRRIVSRIEQIFSKLNAARALREDVDREGAALHSSIVSRAFHSLVPSQVLGEVCDVIDPNPSHRYPAYVSDGVPIVSSSEFVGDDGIDGSTAKRVPLAFFDETLGRHKITAGDVVFSRKGKIGYARPYPAGQVLAMTHTLCVLKPDRRKLSPAFLLHFARSPSFTDSLLSTMNPNVGVPTLGLGVIRAVRIPLPPLHVQEQIADYLECLRSLHGEASKCAAASRSELESVAGAVLEKAFLGDL